LSEYKPYPSEYRYRNALCQKLKADGFEVQPIESGGTGSGIPDLYISSAKRGFYAWMELKNFKIGSLKEVHVPFRPGQLAWLKRFTASGTLCILALATEYGEAYFFGSDLKAVYTREELLEASTTDLKISALVETVKRSMLCANE